MADNVNLLCNEDIFDAASPPAAPPPSGEPLDGDDDDLFREICFKYKSQIGGDQEEEFVRYLVEKDFAHGFRISGGGQSVDFDEWVRRPRIKAIDWILNTRTSLGLRWKTAHLSVCYMDRFLTIFYIEVLGYCFFLFVHSLIVLLTRLHRLGEGQRQWLWAVRLLQMACLSLAAKLEETDAATHSLVSYQDGSINFGCEGIRRMEIHVMNNLKYRLNTSTPFDYIPCFIVKAVETRPSREMVSRIANLVFAFTKEVNLTNHRPASIAIAAIMAGMDQKLEEAAVVARMDTFVYAHLLDVGNVVECYSLMKIINLEDRGENSVITSPDASPGRYDDFDGEGSFSVSFGNAKRRRLDFDRPPDRRPPDL